MQLNPARGRKRARMIARSLRVTLLVYAAQPREGTETDEEALTSIGSGKKVYAAQPREGTETPIRDFEQTWIPNEVYAAQPREGTETSAYPSPPSIRVLWFMQLNPARGRKRPKQPFFRDRLSCHGLCSSTPRGDGNPYQALSESTPSSPGLCSSTPRGDGN